MGRVRALQAGRVRALQARLADKLPASTAHSLCELTFSLARVGGDGHHIELVDSSAASNSEKDEERRHRNGMVRSARFWVDRFVQEYSMVGSTHRLPASETNTLKTGMDSSRPAPQTKRTPRDSWYIFSSK
jgi:hypothetical protein